MPSTLTSITVYVQMRSCKTSDVLHGQPFEVPWLSLSHAESSKCDVPITRMVVGLLNEKGHTPARTFGATLVDVMASNRGDGLH